MSDSDFDAFTPANPATMSEQERRIRKHVRRVAEFYKHLMTYVVVISALWILCLLTKGEGTQWWRYWAIWPTLGWGIGVFFHGLGVLPVFHRFGTDWEERKVKELMAQEARRG
jgi:2TM domain